MKQSQDDGVLKYSPDEDGIFRAEAARGVLSYLLRDVRYRPDAIGWLKGEFETE